MLKNLVTPLSATILTSILAILPLSAHSMVRFNPYTGLWEGNVCANQAGWTYINFQPIGSFCSFRLANGYIIRGVIINQ